MHRNGAYVLIVNSLKYDKIFQINWLNKFIFINNDKSICKAM